MNDSRILDIVSSPADLKLLDDEELSILAQEIREEIVTATSQTGGHVASSLGAGGDHSGRPCSARLPA